MEFNIINGNYDDYNNVKELYMNTTLTHKQISEKTGLSKSRVENLIKNTRKETGYSRKNWDKTSPEKKKELLERRSKIKDLYMNTDLTYKEISEKLGVDFNIVRADIYKVQKETGFTRNEGMKYIHMYRGKRKQWYFIRRAKPYFHLGHIRSLDEAKRLRDLLVANDWNKEVL